VLIATLATLLLTSGAIVTGELLRLTAPRAGFAARPARERLDSPALAPEMPMDDFGMAADDVPEPELRQEPVLHEPRPDLPHVDAPVEAGEIERLAEDLLGAGKAARKVTVLGTAPGEGITLTALTLARLMAGPARIVVVELAASSPTIAEVSVDPAAPGLAELMQGEASFAQIITKDRLSRVHLVNAGRPGFDRSHLQSPRLALAIDALLRVYDHVLLDAGSASDLPAEILTSQARAIVVPEEAMAPEARALMCEQLAAVGFSDVVMLSKPCQASDAVEPGPRVVAA
jgi:Mrp family chromosome partitioning ATPase